MHWAKFVGSICLFIAGTQGSAQAAGTKPHILLVLADDLGYGNVGWLRESFGLKTDEQQTPELDKLVGEGVSLTRFYAYKMCSPTRSSLQSGRLPLHVNIVNKNAAVYNESESTGTGAGIPRNMTGIATKLRQAGYRTHMAGKWDAGMATMDHTPKGKGYDSSLCYFQHANDYWRQTTYRCGNLPFIPVDFWDDDHPAWGLNGTQPRESSELTKQHRNISEYEDYILSQRLISAVESHDPKEPLFMFYAAHLVHAPYEVPQQYLDKMTKFVKNETAVDNVRLMYAAMVNFLDGVVGNLTAAFKAKGMWENTLMLFMSDNGGPIYDAASNYPLRGGKYSDFEGGVRVAAFASGGILSQAIRGTTHGGLGCIADIYTTLCSLAGVDPRDTFAENAGLPAVDGLDLSGMLLSASTASPRKELPLSPLDYSDLQKWDAYDAFLNGSTTKRPACWKVQGCDLLDADLKVKTGVALNDCCSLCDPKDGCVASVWEPQSPDEAQSIHSDKQPTGTCRLKKSAKQQIVSRHTSPSKVCWLPGSGPMPAPIIPTQSGLIVGDLKLLAGTSINMAAYSGPFFPNASTHWIKNHSITVPEFMCSTPYKIGCLFNVSADPTEQNDLALSRPKDARRLLDRLRAWSATRFDPMRGNDNDPRACPQVVKNGGFYGPFAP